MLLQFIRISLNLKTKFMTEAEKKPNGHLGKGYLYVKISS